MDFRKAFDSVSHNKLLYKLEVVGITGPLLNWFEAYLSRRQQCVAIGNHLSDMLPVCSGVPQGCILGPLLFLIYVNDISSEVNFSHIFYLLMIQSVVKTLWETQTVYCYKRISMHLAPGALIGIYNSMKQSALFFHSIERTYHPPLKHID